MIAEAPAQRDVSWPAALGAAVGTFLVAVVMPPLAALAGIIALFTLGLGLGLRRPLARWSTAVATGVIAAVVLYLAIWACASLIDPGAPESGGGSAGPSAAQQQP